ncbi:MAG: hypothetical protein KAG80_18130 [Nocardioides sp.]|nr:hypothetical protein [Nocardioides sp.]
MAAVPALQSPLALLLALVLVLVALSACTTPSTDPGRDPARAGSPTDLSGCRPVDSDRVRGRAPAYLPGDAPLTALPVSDAVCAAVWAPRGTGAFVPQGVAVRGRTAWLTGYDEGQPGALWCRVLRVDLRTGRLLAERARVEGSVGGAPTVGCRHGGGAALDQHGLWLAESSRLWLLDPGSLEVLRVWRLEDPVQGSFTVLAPDGRIGLGRFRPSRVHPGRAALDWFRLSDVLAPGVTVLDLGDAVSSRKVPSHAQGAVWARMGGRTGVWFARSHTRCGVLEGPGGVQRSFLPGAEGMAATSDGLWVVSESSARAFWSQGGRPLVPTLSRVDTSRVQDWPGPACDPAG